MKIIKVSVKNEPFSDDSYENITSMMKAQGTKCRVVYP
jgi:hypothetical protein